MSWWSSAQSSPTKIIRSPPDYVVVQPIQSRRPPGGNLMDQCSAARHPISATGNLTNRPGHDLHLGIDQHPRFSLCSPAGGSVISLPRSERNPCQEHADRFPLGSRVWWHLSTQDLGFTLVVSRRFQPVCLTVRFFSCKVGVEQTVRREAASPVSGCFLNELHAGGES